MGTKNKVTIDEAKNRTLIFHKDEPVSSLREFDEDEPVSSLREFDEDEPVSSFSSLNDELDFNDLLDNWYNSGKVDRELVSQIKRVCNNDTELQKQIVRLIQENEPATLNSLYRQVRDFKDAIKDTRDIESLKTVIKDQFPVDLDKSTFNFTEEVPEEIQPLLEFVKNYHDKVSSVLRRVKYKVANKQNNDDLLFKYFIQYPDKMKNMINKISNKEQQSNNKFKF